MTQSSKYETGPMHGEHTRRFYVIGATILIVAGMIGGYLLGPDDWHIARSMFAGAMVGLWSGFCVFAWHMLLGTIEEEE